MPVNADNPYKKTLNKQGYVILDSVTIPSEGVPLSHRQKEKINLLMSKEVKVAKTPKRIKTEHGKIAQSYDIVVVSKDKSKAKKVLKEQIKKSSEFKKQTQKIAETEITPLIKKMFESGLINGAAYRGSVFEKNGHPLKGSDIDVLLYIKNPEDVKRIKEEVKKINANVELLYHAESGKNQQIKTAKRELNVEFDIVEPDYWLKNKERKKLLAENDYYLKTLKNSRPVIGEKNIRSIIKQTRGIRIKNKIENIKKRLRGIRK